MTSSDFSDDYLEMCAQLRLYGLDTIRDHLIPGGVGYLKGMLKALETRADSV